MKNCKVENIETSDKTLIVRESPQITQGVFFEDSPPPKQYFKETEYSKFLNC